MTAPTFRSSRTDHWTDPKPYSDASLRLRKHGPVHPMDEPATAWALFRFGLRGGLGLALLGIVATILIAASPPESPEAQSPRQVGELFGGKVSE